MPTIPNSTQDRTRQILEDLEAVRENLLALSDDIWLSIDHNDPKALEEGVQFKRTLQREDAGLRPVGLRAFRHDPAVHQRPAGVGGTIGPGGPRAERADRPRVEPRRTPFYRRGFHLQTPPRVHSRRPGNDGHDHLAAAFRVGVPTIASPQPRPIPALPDNADFVSSRGHRGFNRNAEELRSASEIGEGIFAEINLSANGLRDTLRRLLATFEIPATDLRLFLREDRDAARDRESA